MTLAFQQDIFGVLFNLTFIAKLYLIFPSKLEAKMTWGHSNNSARLGGLDSDEIRMNPDHQA